MYKTLILLAVCLSVTAREESRLRVLKMFISDREELREDFKKYCVVRSFMICAVTVIR
jgi:hypothetical protein